MDRISAIRNVEDALRAFENGDADLADTEQRVAAVLRTYATEFDGEDDVFRAVGEGPVDGTIVVAPSVPAARERVIALSMPGRLEDMTHTEKDEVPEFDVKRV